MKRRTILLLTLFISLFLVGCVYEEPIITYKEQERPISEVEEIVESELEIENPNLDLEVSITEDVD